MKQHSKIILYAEDDPDDRTLFSATIKEVNPEYKIICVDNGKKAIQKLDELCSRGVEPCLVILDMNMPIMNGRETLEAIKKNKHWQHLPVAIFTTSSTTLYTDLIKKYHLPVVRKPDRFKSMVDEVGQLLSCCSNC